ncbi:MAG TPA: type I-E CRISPR-associated protein Cas7/Cse4/CasC [Pyrinomonadaceae bacterium]|nr:type I-E CRISPR-associated protein Cas7/Cse4/CasC [Pyrinomonadaceae bacterium]
MILELHLIQNFAPSNLNRSDTGAPKDCIFGGSRRARISSQCFKRAMREYFKDNFAAQNNLAERSTRLVEELASQIEKAGKDKSEAKRVVETALAGIGLKMSSKDPEKTQYLLFLGRDEIKNIADVCLEHYDELLAVAPPDTTDMTAKQAKQAAKGGSVDAVSKALQKVLDGGKAADLALFGRMLADLPDKNRNASSQVAHAISTHKTGVEFDFFTAVDDLKPEDTAGSDHLGTVEFNSACFYRYLNVNTDLLKSNLQGDEELTRATVEAFIRAAVEAIPTGKQNSFATHEKPSFVLAVARSGGMCSLANAFVKSAKASERHDLISDSVARLENHWRKLAEGYGDESAKFVFNISNHDLDYLKDARETRISDLIEKSVNAVLGERREA